MKFIAGNIGFTDNMKQLLPDLSIFDRIIKTEPTVHLNNIWRKQIGVNNNTGINSGSIKNINDTIFYRSCYLIYKSTPITESNVKVTVKNIVSVPSTLVSGFENWGFVQIGDNLYMLFIWIDIEQEYNFNLVNGTTGLFNAEDWFIQVVI